MTGIVDFRTSLLDENGNAINLANPLPTTGGGGGGGSGLSDTVFTDSTGQLIVYRDTGSGTPSAFSVPTWAAYTPTGAVTVSPVQIDNTSSDPVPVEAQSLTILQRIAALLKPLQQVTGAGSNRLSVDVNNITGGTISTVSTVTTVTTVTTCSTVSNVAASTLTNIANVWGFDTAKAISRQAYNSGIRARL